MNTSEGIDSTAEAKPDRAIPFNETDTNRIASLDFIRGIAVMGILAANIVAFGQPFHAYMWPGGFLVSDGDNSGAMWIAQFLIIDGKMRGLFTLLFGAGMMLFLEKAWSKGSGRWLQARRLFWLLIFGLIHFYLIWRGDILILYAVAGFASLACARWTAKTQMTVGLLGYLAGAIVYAAMMVPSYFVADTELGNQTAFTEMRASLDEAKAHEITDGQVEQAIIQNGTYADYVSHNLSSHSGDPLFSLFLFVFETLPLMLIGMALYSMGLFSGGFSRRGQRRWGWIGVLGGTLLTLPVALWAVSTGLTYYGTLAAFIGMAPLPRLPVILGLAALLALWGSHASGWLGQRISAAGRMAFSNYLGTSLLMLLVFHGWAGGLWGQLNRPQLYLVVLLAWVVMLLWSKPWLTTFRYGPLEWLWRCLTYWRIFALKR